MAASRGRSASTAAAPAARCDHGAMPPTILAGTDDGLHVLGDERRSELAGRRIGALAAGPGSVVAVVDDTEIAASDGRGGWEALASLERRQARCLLADADGTLIGTSEAHLLRARGGAIEPVDGFESISGRSRWFTPWGGPPATRSLASGASGELYANVHVGGIPRSDDGGRSWRPTIEIEVDAHEVLAPAGRPGLVLAATARGLAVSRDAGASWDVTAAGLAASYARSVALAGESVLIGASDGPRGGHAAVYRRALATDAPFERCTAGVPGWFADNIDTACLKADGSAAAFGTAGGEVYASDDGGETWALRAGGLPPVRCLLLTAGT